MYSHGLFEPGCYYLVQEKKESPVTLIKVTIESDHCMYVFSFRDEITTAWKRKEDTLFDIIECLSDKVIGKWETEYYSNEDAYSGEDDE